MMPPNLPKEPDSVPCYEETSNPHEEYIAYAEALRSLAEEIAIKFAADTNVIELLNSQIEELKNKYNNLVPLLTDVEQDELVKALLEEADYQKENFHRTHVAAMLWQAAITLARKANP